MTRNCLAPWLGLSTDVNGSIRPCCRYAQPFQQTEYKMPWMKDGTIDELYLGPEMEALRNAFRRGEEPKECSICWDEEAAGHTSFRQFYEKMNRNDFDEKRPTPQWIDLKLSNICNLKCRMCSPIASSSIAKERKELDPYHLSDKIMGTANEEVFFEKILPKVTYLELTGGEPFSSPENKALIKKVAESEYAGNIKLKITTNGMFYVPRLLDCMETFKITDLTLSVDDIGERLEYQRGNSDWAKIQSNIKKMKANYPSYKIVIYRTINIFNIYYLNELDEWAKENNIHVANGYLHYPQYQSIKNLPLAAKEKVREKFKDKYNHVIDFMNLPDENLIQKFYHSNKTLDRIRNESFSTVFAEWNNILND